MQAAEVDGELTVDEQPEIVIAREVKCSPPRYTPSPASMA
jgi:hypothetical protein